MDFVEQRHASVRTLLHRVGVPPHEITPYDPAGLTRGVDTQIRRAEEFLTRSLPDSAISDLPIMDHTAWAGQNHV